jgi:N-acetyltransferase
MLTTAFNLQPTLENQLVRLESLRESDFERLYSVAQDALIWAQHPNPLRHQRREFEVNFQSALASGGALMVFDIKTRHIIGSSWYYAPEHLTVSIGYTFLARSHWGGTFNRAMKTLMLEHAF